jgi:cell division protein ZapA
MEQGDFLKAIVKEWLTEKMQQTCFRGMIEKNLCDLGGGNMPEGKRRFKATIAGKTYTIVGPRSEEHMRVVAETVDEQMGQLSQMTKGLDAEKRAMLMAINAVSDQLEMKKKVAELEEKIKQLEKGQKKN